MLNRNLVSTEVCAQ